MKKKYLLLFLVVLIQFSCETELEPQPQQVSLIYDIADFLITKGYEVEIQDENNLTAQGDIDQMEFLGYINEFYRGIGYPEPYDLKNTDQLRGGSGGGEGDGDAECFDSELYPSGDAVCKNTVCFDENGNLVSFYTTCISCSPCL